MRNTLKCKCLGSCRYTPVLIVKDYDKIGNFFGIKKISLFCFISAGQEYIFDKVLKIIE